MYSILETRNTPKEIWFDFHIRVKVLSYISTQLLIINVLFNNKDLKTYSKF